MNTSQRTQACVIEPVLYQSALAACLRPGGPLSLYELESLTLLADATILFDQQILLNPEIPTIRYADAPPDDHRRAENALRELAWDFVDSSSRLMSYGNSSWFVQARRGRSAERFRSEPIGRNVSRLIPVEDPVVGFLDSNQLAYLDKINAAAASLNATVIHRNHAAANFLARFHAKANAPIVTGLISAYDAALHAQDAASQLGNYREMYHHAPLFLSNAIASAAYRQPADVLTSIRHMRDHATKQYRALCNELMSVNQRSARVVFDEITALLNTLATTDEKIPQAVPKCLDSLVSVYKVYGGFVKWVKGEGDSDGALGETIEAVASLYKDGIVDLKKVDVYRSLGFFNRLHFQRKTSEALYKDIRRVFGPPGFTLQQLDAHFARNDALRAAPSNA